MNINIINIGLIVLSAFVALLVPVEMFLFAYAVLGPLHYLTEISWLHDRQYFTKAKYDYLVLLLIGVLISLPVLLPVPSDLEVSYPWLISVAFFGTGFLAFTHKIHWRIVGFGAIMLLAFMLFQNSRHDTLILIMSSLLPTLIHVFVFTGLFMLYGALKSKSISGMISFLVFLLCPVVLILFGQDQHFFEITPYGKEAYTSNGDGFISLNMEILHAFFNVPLEFHLGPEGVDKAVFHSGPGIMLLRFIAYAYTYHYLNWFSKTNIIGWHQIPRARLITIICLWVASVGLYTMSYVTGLRWLFFLSFTHVLLEFPLNLKSMAGIGSELKKAFRDFSRKAPY